MLQQAIAHNPTTEQHPVIKIAHSNTVLRMKRCVNCLTYYSPDVTGRTRTTDGLPVCGSSCKADWEAH